MHLNNLQLAHFQNVSAACLDNKGMHLGWDGPPHLQVNQKALQRPIRIVNNQMKIELLDEKQLILQNLFQSPLLSHRALLKIPHKLRAGHIKLIHFTGEIRTCQPAKVGREGQTLKISNNLLSYNSIHLHYCPRVIFHQRVVQIESSKIHTSCALKNIHTYFKIQKPERHTR